jgi:sirohydrochlorin ferrochelatase
VLLVPYFLFIGAHVQEDLPTEMAEAKKRHPGVEFAMAKHLGVHRKLAEIVLERIADGLTVTGWH